MSNSELLIMIELIKMEYPKLSLSKVKDMILIEFNYNVSFDKLESLLYDDEDFEKESKLIEYYDLQGR